MNKKSKISKILLVLGSVATVSAVAVPFLSVSCNTGTTSEKPSNDLGHNQNQNPNPNQTNPTTPAPGSNEGSNTQEQPAQPVVQNLNNAEVFENNDPNTGILVGYNDPVAKEVTLDSRVKVIKSNAFSSTTTIKKLTVPGSVKLIEQNAFPQSRNLETIIFQEGVENVQSAAFANVDKVTSVTVANSMKFLPDLTHSPFFQNLLKENMGQPIILGNVLVAWPNAKGEIAIPEGVVTVAKNAFSPYFKESNPDLDQEAKIDKLTIPASVKNLESKAFYRSGIVSVELPSTIEYYGEGLFSSDDELTHVILPDNIKELPASMFEGASSLEEITIPSSVTKLGDSVFRDASSLKQITIPEGVTTIPTNAFSGCDNLHKVVLPNSVTVIKSGAFSSDYDLYDLTIPQNLEYLEDGAIDDTAFISAAVQGVTPQQPAEEDDEDEEDDNSSNDNEENDSESDSNDSEENDSDSNDSDENDSEENTEDENDSEHHEEDNDSDSEEDAAEAALKAQINQAKQQIADKYSKIGYVQLGHVIYAYPKAQGEYVIDSSITQIYANAFSDSHLTKVTIPASVKHIGQSAFSNIETLENVVFEANSTDVNVALGGNSNDDARSLLINLSKVFSNTPWLNSQTGESTEE